MNDRGGRRRCADAHHAAAPRNVRRETFAHRI